MLDRALWKATLALHVPHHGVNTNKQQQQQQQQQQHMVKKNTHHSGMILLYGTAEHVACCIQGDVPKGLVGLWRGCNAAGGNKPGWHAPCTLAHLPPALQLEGLL